MYNVHVSEYSKKIYVNYIIYIQRVTIFRNMHVFHEALWEL